MAAHLPNADSQDLGCPKWGLKPLFLREDLVTCDIPLACGLHTAGLGPGQTTSLPLLPLSVWPSLYLSSYARALLLVLRWFADRLALYGAAALLCLWEEVTQCPPVWPPFGVFSGTFILD